MLINTKTRNHYNPDLNLDLENEISKQVNSCKNGSMNTARENIGLYKKTSRALLKLVGCMRQVNVNPKLALKLFDQLIKPICSLRMGQRSGVSQRQQIDKLGMKHGWKNYTISTK